jgi:hypothetical protein
MRETSLNDHVAALEAALLEYVVKYGLTDKARAVFAASGPIWPCDHHGSDREAPTEEDHHDGRPRPLSQAGGHSRRLAVRKEPYWNILEYGRHIGLRKLRPEVHYWVARTRMRSGHYRQRTFGVATSNSFDAMSFDDAALEARAWFEALATSHALSEPSPVGGTTHLRYVSKGGAYTVGDALADYVSWKRLAAAKTTFAGNLSLINHHMVDRLGDIPSTS